MIRLLCIAFLSLATSIVVPAQDAPAETEADTTVKAPFGQRVKEKFDFTKKVELFTMISSSKTKCDLINFDDSEIRQYTGKTINSVNIAVLDPFEHVDTEKLKRPKFFEMANKLHRTTSDRIVADQLLFEEGDALDPGAVKASHEILYENRYFRDAIIYVEPSEENADEVDVFIVVQDLWSWVFWGEATGDYVGGNLAFNKFAGLPQTLVGGMRFNFDRENIVTPSLRYQYDNIKGSFVRVNAYWMHDWRNFAYEASLVRGFFSSRPQWAGGVRAGWYRTYHPDHDDQSVRNSQDFWLAKSFPLKVMKKEYMNLVLAGRAIRQDYTTAPVRQSEVGFSDPFINSNSYYAGIGVANRNYVQERNVFDYYPYRNLPAGFNMHLIGGVHYHERHATRGYAGLTANHALMTCAGYFQEEFSAGGFISNGMEQVTLSLKSKYFTHRFPLGKWGLRQYVYQSLVYGLQRPEGENLVIGNGGVKGIRFKDYEGSSYYTLNLETEIYSPIRFAGFQARIFAFADLGVQGNRSDTPFNAARVYQAYGMGFRLNNWKLGLAYLEFAFVYYPNTSGLENRPFEFSQNFYNSKVIERNNLYDWNALAPVR